jgi:ferredoxin
MTGLEPGPNVLPMGYEVEIDSDECVSAGKCVASAPGFFVFDDDEIGAVDQSGPRPDDDALLRIARACPSGAIKVTLDGTPVEV